MQLFHLVQFMTRPGRNRIPPRQLSFAAKAEDPVTSGSANIGFLR
jgi:hypothetical protein